MTSPMLLPSNRTPWESAIEGTNAARYPLPVELIAATWSPDDCPVDLLPYLAWAMSVDVWDKDWPETTKREAIRKSLAMHRLKTTPAGIKQHLALIGADVKRIIRPPARAFMRTGMTDEQRVAWLDSLPQIRIYPFANKLMAKSRTFYYGRAVERLFPGTWTPALDNWTQDSSGTFTRGSVSGFDGNSILSGGATPGTTVSARINSATTATAISLLDPASGKAWDVYAYGADAGGGGTILCGNIYWPPPETGSRDIGYHDTGIPIAAGQVFALGWVRGRLHGFVDGNDVGEMPNSPSPETPLCALVISYSANTVVDQVKVNGKPPQYGPPNSRRPTFFGAGAFARKSRGLNEYGRRAMFYDHGVETPVSWTGLDGSVIERIAIATGKNERSFFGRSFFGRAFAQATNAPTHLYTLRFGEGAQAFAVGGSLEPVDVRPQRIAQHRTAPASRMFFGRHSHAHFMRASAGAMLIYDRIAINEPDRTVARRKSSAWYGRGRFGIDPFTAEIKISVPMRRSRRRGARWMGVGFLKGADMSPLTKAIETVRAAKAFRDTILIDTTNYGRATFGGDLRFGNFTFGQILEVG